MKSRPQISMQIPIQGLMMLVAVALATLLIVLANSSEAVVPGNTAVIINSGSTNMIGYRIYITPSGELSYVAGNGQGQGKLSSGLKRRFFRDLAAAMPLSQLPVSSCIKSISFGTSTVVQLGGERSPDLSCPGNAQAEALSHDLTAIAQFLHVTNVPRSEGQELPPQNF
jgi:hypothetical protein